MTNVYMPDEREVRVGSSWQGPPPVLFVFLGTTGRQMGLEPGRLYLDYRAPVDLIVADTELRSVAQVAAANALPLPIPDIRQLRERADAHGELDYILRYTFTDYDYTSSADGTRSSPQEGCVAAAAAYPRLYEMLLNKVTQLGTHVSRSSTEPTRVTIVTVGFAGGGTFAGALPVFLAAQHRVRQEVMSDILVDRVLVITLPSLYDADRRAKAARALALLGGLAAIELEKDGVNVGGGYSLRAPLFETAYLFGTIPEQRGVESRLERQQRYVVQTVRALLEQRLPTSIGSAVMGWRRSLGAPEWKDLSGLPYQFSAAGVAELLFERDAATDLLTAATIHNIYQVLAEGHTDGAQPAQDTPEYDPERRTKIYAMGTEARNTLLTTLVRPEIPPPAALIQAGDGWQGIAADLEAAITRQVAQTMPGELARLQGRLDSGLTEGYRAQLKGSGALLSGGCYKAAAVEWDRAREPRRPNVSIDRGKLALAQAEAALRRAIASPWDSVFTPWPAAILAVGVILWLFFVVLNWVTFPAATPWYTYPFLWAPWQWYANPGIVGPWPWFLPSLGFALIWTCIAAALISWAIFSSPLFHQDRVAKASRGLQARATQRISAHLAWGADNIGHSLDLYSKEEADRRGRSMETKARAIRDAHCSRERLDDTQRGYESHPLWLGYSVAGGHRAALSPLRGTDWLAFAAAKLPLGAGSATERGQAAWREFASYVLREERVAELESGDHGRFHDMLAAAVRDAIVGPAVSQVPNLFEVLKAGNVDLMLKASELLVEATPPILLQFYSQSRTELESHTKPFVELPRGCSEAEAAEVQRVFGLDAQPSRGEDTDRLLVLRVTGSYISFRMVANNGNPTHDEVLRSDLVLRSCASPQLRKALADTDILGRVLGRPTKTEPG